MAVSQTHTYMTYTHTNRKNTHTNAPSPLHIDDFLPSCSALWKVDSSAALRERECYTVLNETIIIFCNSNTNHDSPCYCVGAAYAVSLFCTHIPRWHFALLTLHSVRQHSFFLFQTFSFWVFWDAIWGDPERDRRHKRKNVPKNNLTLNCIFVFALGLS